MTGARGSGSLRLDLLAATSFHMVGGAVWCKLSMLTPAGFWTLPDLGAKLSRPLSAHVRLGVFGGSGELVMLGRAWVIKGHSFFGDYDLQGWKVYVLTLSNLRSHQFPSLGCRAERLWRLSDARALEQNATGQDNPEP